MSVGDLIRWMKLGRLVIEKPLLIFFLAKFFLHYIVEMVLKCINVIFKIALD